MKDKILVKLMAVFLSLTLLTGCTPGPSGKNTDEGDTGTEPVTMGELADYFIKAADDYNPDADRAVVLENFKEDDKATYMQLLVLASRAFGELKAPTGYAKEIAPKPVNISDTPKWARNALKNLSEGGILDSSDITDNPATLKDARIIAARFYTLFGKNKKDDFYTAVNKKELDSLKIPEGKKTAGGSSEVEANTNRQLQELIMEIVNSGEKYENGSAEQKIRDLYLNFENEKARSQAGLEPLKKYLEAVDAAGDFSELNAAVAQAVKELGNSANGLFPGVAVTDTKDSSRKLFQFMILAGNLSADDYKEADGEAYKEYRKSMIEQLLAVGENQKDAKHHADKILKMEKELAENAPDGEQSSEIPEQKYYTPEGLDKMMPEAKVSEFLAAIGLKGDVKITALDDNVFKAYSKWFEEKNLELFKSVEKTVLLTGYCSALSSELEKKFGYGSVPTADIAVQKYLSEELAQLYVKRYFPAESKAEIEEMVKLMTEAFKKRIKNLNWMEENTKKEAIKKLDSLTVLIGYPDEWQSNDAAIRSADDGGSYFENVTSSEAEMWKKELKSLEQPVDPRSFSLSAYTVNAAAGRDTNTIIFPAGILQAPFYDKNASFEHNLGAIGSTIAHEITHMFDDEGAQYDAEGNVKSWWSDKDYKHFKELCGKAAAFYDGWEAAPGIAVDGKGTLSENIADIGGVACGLEILSNREKPDYDAFFTSYANQWLRVADHDTLSELNSDEHSPNNLRCNKVLVNFQEFYDTYGIKPGDGMYVAPEERIKIW